MNCANCGSSMLAGGKFCENCGMAVARVEPKTEPKIEERAAAPEQRATPPAQPASPKKMIPTWFVVISMVLSFLTAIGIAGLFIPSIPDMVGGPLLFAGMYLGATAGIATLFYIFMLIFFLAKHYGHGSKLIPMLHLILYAVAGGGVGAASGFLYQSQIAMVLLGAAAGISFVQLCVGLYFVLREKPQE